MTNISRKLHKPHLLLSMIILSFLFSLYANVKLQVNFPEKQNCVAYKTNKSMIFQDSVDVVGLNCSVTVSIKKENGKSIITASIPLDKFDSGEKGRDKYVFNYLHGKTRPALLFTSKLYSGQELQKILNGSGKDLSGTLQIGNDSFPVSFSITKNKDYVKGEMQTRFSDFNLKPPSVGPFGLVAEVRDYLELHFQTNLTAL